jgi:exopolyphosphatase/guanosine-5'-triphosphate,3'-diphosphate pyrophosphatase
LLTDAPDERVEESDEVYLLSLESDASVKVRAGLMDVKHLDRVEEGLEQWRPVLKAPFPLSASDLGSVLEELGVAAPVFARAAYTLDELLAEVVEPSPALRAVEVHKHRERHTFGGCMAELTEVSADSQTSGTIAVESEDPAAVLAAVRELGLEDRRNVCFARGLKSLVGFGSKRYGVIDVGTNSVKLHVGELGADGDWRPIDDRSEVTRLGEGLEETGALAAEPMARTVDAIASFVDEARKNGVQSIVAVATAGPRVASNRAEFVDEVRARCGFGLEVIGGEDEARLAFLAVKSGMNLEGGTLVVFDTGGGSSQFTFGHGDVVDERFSVHVGAVRFAEQFGLDGVVSEDVVREARAEIGADLARLDDRPAPDAFVGLGGAVTNLAAVKLELDPYDPEAIRGTVLDRAEIDRQIELYRTRTADERREIVGLQPKRAEVILAGACIVRTVMEKLGCESLTVSDLGLRHGVLVERFGQ